MLGVAKAVIAVGFLVWLAGVVSGLVERRIAAMPRVSPAAGVLLGKLFRIAVYTLAVVVGLDAVGIDLTAFAVFSGAVEQIFAPQIRPAQTINFVWASTVRRSVFV